MMPQHVMFCKIFVFLAVLSSPAHGLRSENAVLDDEELHLNASVRDANSESAECTSETNPMEKCSGTSKAGCRNKKDGTWRTCDCSKCTPSMCARGCDASQCTYRPPPMCERPTPRPRP